MLYAFLISRTYDFIWDNIYLNQYTHTLERMNGLIVEAIQYLVIQ